MPFILRPFLTEDFWPEWAARRWFSLERVVEHLAEVGSAVDVAEEAELAYAATEEVLNWAVVCSMVPEHRPYVVTAAVVDLVQDSWAIHQVSLHRWLSPVTVSRLADHPPLHSQPEASPDVKTG